MNLVSFASIVLGVVVTLPSLTFAQSIEEAEELADRTQTFLTELAEAEVRDDAWATAIEEHFTTKVNESAKVSNMEIATLSIACYTTLCVYDVEANHEGCSALAFEQMIEHTAIASIGGEAALVDLSLFPLKRADITNNLSSSFFFRDYTEGCHRKGVFSRLSDVPMDFPSPPSNPQY